MTEKDIAVLGMDCRFPGASDYREFWANLSSGEDSVTEVPSERWDWREVFGDPEAEPGRTNSRWGGFVSDIGGFDPLFFGMSPKQARFVDPQQRIALESAWSAIEDAGYAASDLAGSRTGVYVGVSKNDYAELMREHGVSIPSYVSTGTVHSIIANRISFLFDLKGRSSVVDTACSSSLVALHDAIRDLRLGECETALVGGVNALLSPTMYISHAQSGMLSADGRCKVFDADANGYVRGEGVAFVLLKPLDRALADGDRVVGVIKGSAVNHGGRGNSLTTPSVTGQAEVIATALKNAAIDADSIGYVEAHGTGTALGDPIEIRALAKAFSEQGGERQPQSCPVGAVKTNIGHLESASGMAGLIKVLLMLRHHRIPPSLHLEQPNPYIDFDATPFSPVREGHAWTGRGSLPRRAGLSAFGMGGVNAHVIVEEAPTAEADPEPRRPVAPQVIPLSAKSEAALTRMRIRLREFLRGPGADLDIHDIAFTLQAGRASLPHRAAWLASETDELVERLDIDDEPEVAYHGSTSQATAAPREETAPASRARQWVQGRFDDWRAAGPVPEGRRVALPTYPFDRSRHWFEEPAREQRADTDDHGTMPEQPVSEIRKNDYFVRDHVVAGRAVMPGVAYFELVRRQAQARFGRTPMSFRDVHWLRVLEVGERPLALRVDWEERDGGAAFEVKLDDTVYALGEIRFEASELPELTAPVSQRLSRTEAPDGLYERFAAYGLEYGSSFRVIDFCRTGTDEALCRVQRREPEKGADALELEPSLLDGAFQSAVALSLFGARGSDDQYVPFALGSFDLYGPLPAAVTVHVIERDTVKEVRRFDIVLRDDAGAVVARMAQLQKRPHRPRADKTAERLELGTEWVDEPLAMRCETVESVVLFSDDAALRKNVEYTIGAGRVIGVGSGETLEQSPEGDYRVDRRDSRQLATLFERLAERNAGHRIVLHTDPMSPTTDPGDLEALLGIAQGAVRLRHLGPVRVLHVHPDTSDAPFGALTGGFARTLAYETPDVSVLSVGVEDTEETSTANIVRNELSHYDHAPLREVAYRGGRRLVRVVRELPVQGDPGTSLFRPGGTYVLSGGAGGVGRVLSRHLARRYGAELVWLGRSPRDAAIDAELAAVEEIGGRARYFACDVSNENDVRQVFGELEQEGVTVNGVIHAAGLIDDTFIQRMSPESVRRVLAPKVHGALALDRATDQLSLDLFIVFSSIAAVMPNQGQGAYAAANGFLDAFAAHRQALVDAGERSGRSLSIAWPLWRDGGIQVSGAEREHLVEAFGMEPIRDHTGIEILEQCARQPQGRARTPGHIIVAEGDREKLRTRLQLRPGRWGTPAIRPLERAEAVLERIIAPGLEKGLVYDAGLSYGDLGLDSLDLVDLASRLAVAYRREVSPTDLFEHPTPQGTAAWLAREPRPVPSLIDEEHSDPDALQFGKSLPTDVFFMRDHVVNGQFNVPGVCFLELAVQAALLAEPGRGVGEVTNNSWIIPLSSPGEPIALEVRMARHGDHYEYEVGRDVGGTWTVHATGEVSYTESERSPLVSMPEAATDTSWGRPVSVDAVYAQILAEGLHVGPTFQPVVEARVSRERAFTRLRLPESIRGTFDDYTLHPTLLTGVLQTALLNNKPDGPDGTRFIPMGVDTLKMRGVIGPDCTVTTWRTSKTGASGIAKFDAVVQGPDGAVVAEVAGVSLRRVDGGRTRTAAKTADRRPVEGPEDKSLELEQVEALLKELTSEIIELPAAEMGSETEFGDFGIDSLMIIDLNRCLEEAFGRLSKSLFFEYQTFRELAHYFLDAHAVRVRELLSGSTETRDV